MIDQNTEAFDIFDELASTDFSDVDTSMPILAPGLYEFEVVNIERKLWKSGEGSSLFVSLKLMNEAQDVSGEREIQAGLPLTAMISLVRKGAYNPTQEVARFLEAIGMKDTPFDPSFESYRGATLLAKTKVTPERTNEESGEVYPPRAEVARFVRPS